MIPATNVLITGANGFVGKALCAELSRQDYFIRACMRSKDQGIVANESVIVKSIDESTDWSAALNSIVVVIHLAARVHKINKDANQSLEEHRKINTFGTLNLAEQAARQGVKRFIFLSSVKVNGEQTELGKPFTEDDAPNPQDNYGLSKYEAEKGLSAIAQKTGMEIVIIRPPLVYGLGVKANFAIMMQAVQRGIPLPFGAICNKRSLVSLQNLNSLIQLCINHPAAANQVFMVSDDCDLSTPELLRACAEAQGVQVRLFAVPPVLLMSIASLLGKKTKMQRLCGSLQVDIAKAHQLLGWVPPFSVKEGLEAITQTCSAVHNG